MKEVVKRYSQAFKQEVVKEYEEGASESSLRKKYGIKGATTIKGWVKKYSRKGYRAELAIIQSVEDQAEYQAMKKRVRELERALAEVVLEKRMLETTLEVASKRLEIDLKKSFGQK